VIHSGNDDEVREGNEGRNAKEKAHRRQDDYVNQFLGG